MIKWFDSNFFTWFYFILFNPLLQIVEHTRKPSYIRQLADTFQERYLNGPYIAFHYRYDAGEWSSVCARPQQGRKGEVCVVLEKTGSKGLALALTRFILQTNAFITGAGQKKSTIYVASPPTEAQKIKEVLNLAAAIMSGEGWTLDIVSRVYGKYSAWKWPRLN